jgi:hypothetical protein
MNTTLFFDFETFYSQTYSLMRMSPAEYILDPLFEAICLGAAPLHGEPVLIDGPEIPEFIAKLKHWQLTRPLVVVSHNAQFDAAILSWRYDFHPDMLIDTIALSRTVLGPKLYSHALGNIASYYGLPSKGTMVKEVKGMTRADIMACGMWQREVEYCLHDTWLCREIFRQLVQHVRVEELVLHGRADGRGARRSDEQSEVRQRPDDAGRRSADENLARYQRENFRLCKGG